MSALAMRTLIQSVETFSTAAERPTNSPADVSGKRTLTSRRNTAAAMGFIAKLGFWTNVIFNSYFLAEWISSEFICLEIWQKFFVILAKNAVKIKIELQHWAFVV